MIRNGLVHHEIGRGRYMSIVLGDIIPKVYRRLGYLSQDFIAAGDIRSQYPITTYFHTFV